MRRTVRLVELFPGSARVAVYRPCVKDPHFIIVGATADDLDISKVTEYMYEVDWSNRGAKGWVMPELRCDDFLKKDDGEIQNALAKNIALGMKKIAKAPKDWGETVEKMKEHEEIEKPFALAYHMKEKGAKPHYPKKKKSSS